MTQATMRRTATLLDLPLLVLALVQGLLAWMSTVRPPRHPRTLLPAV
jgi:hypothetical protein